ncbi:uncharacterized protein N7483_012673 [Penicillium malachiteum]|uniref:uncharacterized protein n=1 Tax=Penicillium malachiteum TaxID=1324776 RepID=UPI002547A2C3|nr:uncharacterized protein N7483_012673 [Penicillium malachiteum]KAJ5715492.1 hypothetical protein N7483_012673 [Penicillium malachiteum]
MMRGTSCSVTWLMIHRAHRDAGKSDCAVSGLAAIGSLFWFHHITDSGDWARAFVKMEQHNSEDPNKISAILRAMIVDGAKQDPVPFVDSFRGEFSSVPDDNMDDSDSDSDDRTRSD